MTRFNRRTLLVAAPLVALPACAASATAGPRPTTTTSDREVIRQLKELEAGFAGRIGVRAFRTDRGPVIDYRAGERFALLSTFKALAGAAVLRRARQTDPGLMSKLVRYTREELVTHSPITEQHVDTGMTVSALCDATIRYSDNTAGNLVLRELGGPAGITRFARGLGDPHTRLDRWETDLNTNLPGDERDTTTPGDMADNLEKLVLGRALAKPDRAQLTDWLVRNTTGDKRIRAGVPAGWRVGDKTGTGDYGSANDVAIAWPPDAEPLVIAVYTIVRRRSRSRTTRWWRTSRGWCPARSTAKTVLIQKTNRATGTDRSGGYATGASGAKPGQPGPTGPRRSAFAGAGALGV